MTSTSRSAAARSSTARAPRAASADVGVDDGRIVAIGARRAEAAQEIDAAGLAVAPGFIDIHSHSDYTLLVDPRAVERDPPGRHDRGRRQLRLRLLPDPRPSSSRRRRSTATRDDVPLTWTLGRRVLRAARGGAAGGQRAQPRPERAAAARDARPRRPAGATPAELARDAGPAATSRSSRAPGATRPGSSTRRSRRASEDELDGAARGDGAASTRRTRAGATTGAADAVAEAIRTGASAEVRLQVSHLVPRNGIEESRRCIELVDAARDAGHGRRVRHAHARLRD